MANLFASLLSSTSALRAYDRTLATVQNNVTNASTPGYVKQRQILNAASFMPELGISGGVLIGERQSYRSAYTEQMVRQQQNSLGQSQELKSTLTELEPIFDATGDAGVPAALSKLFQSFSVLSVSPNDSVARQGVLDQADAVGRAFNQTALGIENASTNASRQVEQSVDQINRLAGKLAGYNAQIQKDLRNSTDPAVDAGIYSTLEELSQIVDVQVIQQDNGTFNVLMSGQTPLVVSDRQYKIAADTGSSSSARILDTAGADVTERIQGGSLRAQLDFRNQMAPAWLARLDTLASNLATQVNTQLTEEGVDANGQPGAALFAVKADHAARTLGVAMTDPLQLAAALETAPGGNGNALVLSAFGGQQKIGNATFAGYYAAITADFGRELSGAKQNQDTAQQLVVQAQTMRQEESGVSLDEEAARLIEFQRSYQATAKLVSVLDDLTQTLIDMIR